MNSFDKCRSVEARSFEILKPYFAEVTDDGRWVLTDKGQLSAQIQQAHGDVVMQKNGEMVFVEVKAEEGNYHGNFFIEEWSNRSRYNPGWLLKLDTDFLFYHFIEDDELYIFDFRALQYWAFCKPSKLTGHAGRLYDYRSALQGKYDQRNDTWGRLVPIVVLVQEVPCKLVNPRTGNAPEPVRPAQTDLFGNAQNAS